MSILFVFSAIDLSKIAQCFLLGSCSVLALFSKKLNLKINEKIANPVLLDRTVVNYQGDANGSDSFAKDWSMISLQLGNNDFSSAGQQ